MKLANSLLMTAAAMVTLCGPLQAGGEGWTSDFEAAKAQAFKEGKDLLIDFTGSDWCGWCIKLNKEVFVHDAFKEGVKDKFVLVELDFPRNEEKIAAATLEQNKALAKTYGVRGYPTIMLTDAEGRPYAKTGYRRGGPEAYVTHLDELRATRIKRDEHLAAAAKAEGVEKAKALVEALKSMSISNDQIAAFYGGLVEQIKASDPEDASGYLKGIAQKERFDQLGQKINELVRNKDMEGALKVVDDTLAEGGLENGLVQRLIMTKAMIYANMKRLDDSLAQIDKALAADPGNSNNDGIKAMREKIAAAAAQDEAKKAEADKAEADKSKEEVKEAPEAAVEDKQPIRVRDK